MNYRFNEEQRRQLTKLGVYEKQILELERSALPAASAALAKEPTIQDVRDKLAEVMKAIDAALNAMTSLRRAAHFEIGSAAWSEVFQRIERADFVVTAKDQGDELHCRGEEPVLTKDGWLCPPSRENDHGEVRDTEQHPGESVERAYRALVPLSNTVRHASEALNREAAEIKQRRPGTWFPIQLIDEALRKGFDEHQKAETAKGNVQLQHYNLKPLSSETSKFFAVVAICYEVIGHEERSLEAPIRAYIDWLNNKDQAH